MHTASAETTGKLIRNLTIVVSVLFTGWACANPTAPTLESSEQLQVCMRPDTIPVTVSGDSTAFVFQKCF